MTSNSFDLSLFGARELDMAAKILTAWSDNGLPEDFYKSGVHLEMNHSSGCVSLTNDECQVCTMNGDELEMFYWTPYSGIEGFADDLIEQLECDTDYFHDEDIEYLIDAGILEPEDYACADDLNSGGLDIRARLIDMGKIDDE